MDEDQSHIEKSLQHLAVPIGIAQSMKDNPRKHGDESIEAIKASLAEFGQQKPIVVTADNVVIAGNGTLEAARQLGWSTIAVSRTELTEQQAVAYSLADNRTQDKSEFDFGIVRDIFKGLDDTLKNATGFTQSEIDDLLRGEEGGEEHEVGGKSPESMGDTEFRVIVIVQSAEDQENLINRLEEEGYKCLPLMS